MSLRDLITEYVINTDEMSAGIAAHLTGGVQDLHWEDRFDPDTLERAIIADGTVNGERPRLAIIEGAAPETYCSCEIYRAAESTGFCRHQVALLRATFDALNMAQATVDEDKRQLDADQLLAAYEADLSLVRESPLELLPTLDFDPYTGRFALTFRIARDESHYIIKNLSDFVDRLTHKEVFRYGKYLEVAHDRRYFSEGAQFYIDLLLTSLALYREAGGTPPVKRYLYLTPGQFDRFFDFIAQSEDPRVDVQANGKATSTRTLTYADPKDTLSLRQRLDGRYQLSLEAGYTPLKPGGRYRYLMTKETIIRPSAVYNRYVMPLYDFLDGHEAKTLVLTEDEAAAFCANALTPLAGLLQVELSQALRQRFAQKPLHAHMLISYPAEDCLSGLLTFRYGDTSFNPLLAQDDKEALRDLAAEEDIFALLRAYRFSVNEDEVLLVGEEALYNFLLEGLPQLMALATVDIEERLRRIRPKNPVIPQMSSSINHGTIELSFDDTEVDIPALADLLKAYRHGRRYIRLKNGQFLNLVNPAVAELDQLLNDLDLDPEDLTEPDPIELPTYRAVRLQALVDESPLNLHLSDDLRTLADRLMHLTEEPIAPPESLQAVLRPYQVQGYRWLVGLSRLGMGGILADDMGLGKTIQAIAYLLYRKRRDPEATALIVVPTSLIYNWEDELARFAPSLPYRIITGNADERREAIQEAPVGSVLVTSYATLRRDHPLYSHFTFDTIFADEAQFIKNSYTQNAKSLKSLSARHRFALTGTPMENALADLWSIMDFCMPGYLLSWRQFRHIYDIPISRYEDESRLYRLRLLMAPFLLRRVKSDVLTELPEKIETTLYTELSHEERRIYDSQLALSKETVIQALANEGLPQNRIKILALLMRLRQVCCSPRLFLPSFDQPSSKLKLAVETIMERQQHGHRMILFSQFTSMIDLISEALDRHGIDHLILTGQTKADERMALIRRFQGGSVPVFLISLKAGGTGLNLTAADTVIHFDPWWNQSVEDQATDRTHRIGQKRTVHVIRLICKHTIEEKIMALKEKKSSLSDQIVGESKGLLSSLTPEDLRDLFDLGPRP
ncbi:DEAD/DEAH box helicase [Peptococcus simiae]|uniref:DEAD/DEAH box helicase n=1 Tax=Peptococcus simiae TaxID=1643805 RepID=UPI00397FB560